jgi:AraC-like DNA-binding protein
MRQFVDACAGRRAGQRLQRFVDHLRCRRARRTLLSSSYNVVRISAWLKL